MLHGYWRAMKRLAPLLILAFAFTTAGQAATQRKPEPAPILSAADKALIDSAGAYLSGLKTAQARFSQTDPRGAVTGGTFYLQRPGKARFAYDAPTDLTVVADGVNVNVYDGRLKTFDQYPLARTPIALLLAADVKFDRAAVMTGVVRDKSGFTVIVRDVKKQAEGRLLLSFSTAPVALMGWTVIDGQGLKTIVRLNGLKSGVGLDSKLFELRNPTPKPSRIKP